MAAPAAAAALSAGLSAAGCAVIVRRGWIDHPGERSSHTRPTRTGGGVAIALAALVALATVVVRLPPRAAAAVALSRASAAAVLGAAAMAALGVADDRHAVGARLKLALGVVVALATALAMPPVRAIPLAPGVALPLWAPLGVAGAALWLVTATNAVNFMDGANGLAPGGLLVAFCALALGAAAGGDAGTACAGALAAAAYAGFLPWNLRGRLFQGDAGSLFGGFLVAALHLAATSRGALPLLFGPVLLLPWLTDVLLTLLRRARGGQPLLQAHREHLYQRWLTATGRTHAALARRNVVACAVAGAAALAMSAAPRGWQAAIFAAAVIACIAAWTWTSRRLDRATA